MNQVIIYTTTVCSYCMAAKRLLTKIGVPYSEISLEDDDELRQKLSDENGGWRTVPMIFIGKTFIGGFNELNALVQQGKLDALLKT